MFPGKIKNKINLAISFSDDNDTRHIRKSAIGSPINFQHVQHMNQKLTDPDSPYTETTTSPLVSPTSPFLGVNNKAWDSPPPPPPPPPPPSAVGTVSSDPPVSLKQASHFASNEQNNKQAHSHNLSVSSLSSSVYDMASTNTKKLLVQTDSFLNENDPKNDGSSTPTLQQLQKLDDSSIIPPQSSFSTHRSLLKRPSLKNLQHVRSFKNLKKKIFSPTSTDSPNNIDHSNTSLDSNANNGDLSPIPRTPNSLTSGSLRNTTNNNDILNSSLLSQVENQSISNNTNEFGKSLENSNTVEILDYKSGSSSNNGAATPISATSSHSELNTITTTAMKSISDFNNSSFSSISSQLGNNTSSTKLNSRLSQNSKNKSMTRIFAAPIHLKSKKSTASLKKTLDLNNDPRMNDSSMNSSMSDDNHDISLTKFSPEIEQLTFNTVSTINSSIVPTNAKRVSSSSSVGVSYNTTRPLLRTSTVSNSNTTNSSRSSSRPNSIITSPRSRAASTNANTLSASSSTAMGISANVTSPMLLRNSVVSTNYNNLYSSGLSSSPCPSPSAMSFSFNSNNPVSSNNSNNNAHIGYRTNNTSIYTSGSEPPTIEEHEEEEEQEQEAEETSMIIENQIIEENIIGADDPIGLSLKENNTIDINNDNNNLSRSGTIIGYKRFLIKQSWLKDELYSNEKEKEVKNKNTDFDFKDSDDMVNDKMVFTGSIRRRRRRSETDINNIAMLEVEDVKEEPNNNVETSNIIDNSKNDFPAEETLKSKDNENTVSNDSNDFETANKNLKLKLHRLTLHTPLYLLNDPEFMKKRLARMKRSSFEKENNQDIINDDIIEEEESETFNDLEEFSKNDPIDIDDIVTMKEDDSVDGVSVSTDSIRANKIEIEEKMNKEIEQLDRKITEPAIPEALENKEVSIVEENEEGQQEREQTEQKGDGETKKEIEGKIERNEKEPLEINSDDKNSNGNEMPLETRSLSIQDSISIKQRPLSNSSIVSSIENLVNINSLEVSNSLDNLADKFSIQESFTDIKEENDKNNEEVLEDIPVVSTYTISDFATKTKEARFFEAKSEEVPSLPDLSDTHFTSEQKKIIEEKFDKDDETIPSTHKNDDYYDGNSYVDDIYDDYNYSSDDYSDIDEDMPANNTDTDKYKQEATYVKSSGSNVNFADKTTAKTSKESQKIKYSHAHSSSVSSSIYNNSIISVSTNFSTNKNITKLPPGIPIPPIPPALKHIDLPNKKHSRNGSVSSQISETMLNVGPIRNSDSAQFFSKLAENMESHHNHLQSSDNASVLKSSDSIKFFNKLAEHNKLKKEHQLLASVDDFLLNLETDNSLVYDTSVENASSNSVVEESKLLKTKKLIRKFEAVSSITNNANGDLVPFVYEIPKSPIVGAWGNKSRSGSFSSLK